MKRETQSDVLLIAVTLIAAISWMFSKEAIALMPPLLFMGLRFLLAAAFLACLGHQALRRLSMGHVLRSARVGLVFGAVMLILEPIWVALFAAAWFGETLMMLQWLGCSMIFFALLVNRWQLLRSILTKRGL